MSFKDVLYSVNFRKHFLIIICKILWLLSEQNRDGPWWPVKTTTRSILTDQVSRYSTIVDIQGKMQTKPISREILAKFALTIQRGIRTLWGSFFGGITNLLSGYGLCWSVTMLMSLTCLQIWRFPRPWGLLMCIDSMMRRRFIQIWIRGLVALTNPGEECSWKSQLYQSRLRKPFFFVFWNGPKTLIRLEIAKQGLIAYHCLQLASDDGE